MSRKGDTLNLLTVDLKAIGAPDSEWEYRFHPTRKWRFDLAWPERKIAVEVDGGTWTGGRHVSGSGYEGDCQKLNAAAVLGWRVLRFTPGMIASGEAAETLQAVLR